MTAKLPDYVGCEIKTDSGNSHNVICHSVPEPFAYRYAQTNYPDFAAELVRRWNAFPRLIETLEFLRDCTPGFEGEFAEAQRKARALLAELRKGGGA